MECFCWYKTVSVINRTTVREVQRVRNCRTTKHLFERKYFSGNSWKFSLKLNMGGPLYVNPSHSHPKNNEKREKRREFFTWTCSFLEVYKYVTFYDNRKQKFFTLILIFIVRTKENYFSHSTSYVVTLCRLHPLFNS